MIDRLREFVREAGVWVCGLVLLIGIAIGLLMFGSGCAGVSREERSVTVADEGWGVKVRMDANGKPWSIYVQGPEGFDEMEGEDWRVSAGRSESGRMELLLVDESRRPADF